MNKFLRHVIDTLAANVTGIRAMVLRGSQQTGDEVDLWSDIDLEVILELEMKVDETQFIKAHDKIGFVVGSESYSKKDEFFYRTAIAFESSIHLLDATVYSYDQWVSVEAFSPKSSTIVYGQIEIGKIGKEIAVDYSFDPYNDRIHQTWFLYIGTIKKFARNDNLIGMHLLLDLIREYLVVEMIERDIRQNTHIHRFGYGERLPDSIKLSQIDESDKVKIFEYIDRLAYEYDKKLSENLKDYISRYEMVSKFIDKSLQCVQLHQ